MSTFFSATAPSHPLPPLRRSLVLYAPPSSSALSLPRRNLTACCSVSSSSFNSSSSSTSVAEDQGSPLPDTPAPTDELGAVAADSDVLSLSSCKACGREEIESGCNGEGRIQGGIATIPGFGWWPIKAYRPCPGFLASGGKYKRQGQSMDEVVSGGGKGGTPTVTYDEPVPKNRGTDRRMFKP